MDELFGDDYYHAMISRLSHAYVHGCMVEQYSHASSALLCTFKEVTPRTFQNA